MIYQCNNPIMQSCSYIICEHHYKDCYLVDCGDFNEIKIILESQSLRPRGIFLTHCHFDHTYGINELLLYFPECKIYGSEETIEGLYDAKINISYYQGKSFILDAHTKTIPICSSTKINIFDTSLHVYATPGHDIGCLSYQYKTYLFTGDSYIPFAPVFARWKRSDKEIAKQQEYILKKYADNNNLQIMCGHYQI